MNQKKVSNASTMRKRSALILAAFAFAVGFLVGVVFTALKTSSSPGAFSINSQQVDYSKREDALTVEVQRNPNNTTAWIQLGNVYFDTDQYANAVEAYEKALELNPNNADVLTDLGIMYRRYGQPRKAIEIFDRAIAVDSKHEQARFNKGIVQMHDLKDREEALRTWEALLAINPVAIVGNNQNLEQLIRHYKESHDSIDK